jgi:hypothetical protein
MENLIILVMDSTFVAPGLKKQPAVGKRPRI